MTVISAALAVHRIRLHGPLDPSTMDSAERARAASLRFDRDRRRFVAGRAALRRVLGEHLGIAPEAVVFTIGEHGKPRVEGLWFSFSRSADRALVAVGREEDGPLGVDLERVRPEPADEALARTILADAELSAWRALPAAARPRALMQWWTRKEAVMKADGRGLGIDPRTLEVASSLSGYPLEARFRPFRLDVAPNRRGQLTRRVVETIRSGRRAERAEQLAGAGVARPWFDRWRPMAPLDVACSTPPPRGVATPVPGPERIPRQAARAADWRVQDLDVGEGFVAALATPRA